MFDLTFKQKFECWIEFLKLWFEKKKRESKME